MKRRKLKNKQNKTYMFSPGKIMTMPYGYGKNVRNCS